MTDKNEETTIILDFNAKSSVTEENLSKDPSEQIAINENIQFIVKGKTEEKEEKTLDNHKNIDEPSREVAPSNFDVFYLTLDSQFFDKIKLKSFFPNFKKCLDINGLNETLTKGTKNIIILYFNSSPTTINQILKQINKKFPKTKTLLIAKNLSEQKANQHQNSSSGASKYLSYPFSAEQLEESIKDLSKG